MEQGLITLPVLRREIALAILETERPRYSVAKAIVKVVRVLTSCTNSQQLNNAYSYLTLFNSRYPTSSTTQGMLNGLLHICTRKTII